MTRVAIRLLGAVLWVGIPAAPAASGDLPPLWPDAQEIESFLREAEIVERRKLGEGVTNPEKITLEKDGVIRHAVFKQVDGPFDSWRFEVAAYRTDAALGLGMVPPTVERRLGGRLGCVQLWVEGTTMDRLEATPPDLDAWRAQVSVMWLFDDLIGNIDRHGHNAIVTPEFRLVLIDNSKSFTRDPALLYDLNRAGASGTRALFWQVPFDPDRKEFPTRYPTRLVERLRSWSARDVRDAVGRYLQGYDRKLLIERRALVLRRLDRIGAGEDVSD